MDLGAIAGLIGNAAKAVGSGAKKLGGMIKENYASADPEMKAAMFDKFSDMAMGGQDSGFYKHMDVKKLPRQKICGGQCGPLKKGK